MSLYRQDMYMQGFGPSISSSSSADIHQEYRTYEIVELRNGSRPYMLTIWNPNG